MFIASGSRRDKYSPKKNQNTINICRFKSLNPKFITLKVKIFRYFFKCIIAFSKFSIRLLMLNDKMTKVKINAAWLESVPGSGVESA